MVVTLRRYSPKNGAVTKASLDLLRRQIHDEFLPKAQSIAGFRGYYLVSVDNKEILTISVYDSAEGANECTRCAAEYTLRNPLIYELGRPEITEGEVLTSAALVSLADESGEAVEGTRLVVR